VHYGADRQLSAATHPLTRAHYHFNCQDQISEESCRERDVGPTCEFTASPEVGPGATIGTLQTRYPRVQASSQDSGQDVHPRAATHPATPGRPTPHPSSGGLRLCHASRGSGPHHASEMGSDVPACHMALEPTASHKRASVLARIPWHSVGRENKERLSYECAAGLACYQGMHTCYRGVCKTCG
jgi:hypothetical protein